MNRRRRTAAWIGIAAFFTGVLLLGGWAAHDCEHRGGHLVRIAGRIWKCNK